MKAEIENLPVIQELRKFFDLSSGDEVAINRQLLDAHHFLLERLEYVGSGRCRRTYRLNADWVIKLPQDFWALADNTYEARAFENPDISYPLAECFLIDDVILVMEFCSYVHEDAYDLLPKWVRKVDSCQVGYNARGDLVCYDYGCL